MHLGGRLLAVAVLVAAGCIPAELATPPPDAAAVLCADTELPTFCPPQPDPIVQTGPNGTMLVRGGCYVMGCDPATDPTCVDHEQPRHAVTVGSFFLDRTEVTQDAYLECMDAGICGYAPSENGSTMPATRASFYDARRYCAWRGMRLPTEMEWEYAARGIDGRLYPWGNDPPVDCTKAAVGWDCPTLPVGSHPLGVSPFGLEDMAGNAIEWVADRDHDYCTPPDYGYDVPDTQGEGHIVRGDANVDGRTTWRGAYNAASMERYLGVRCARSIDDDTAGSLWPCDVTHCPSSYTCTYPQQPGHVETIPMCCHAYTASVAAPLASAACWSEISGCVADPGREADPGFDQAICTPSGAIQCDWPEGSVSCPALWIIDSDVGRIYKNGCCGSMFFPATATECGVIADTGCVPPQPGDQPVY